jgi:hypothetical protein
MPDKSNRSKRPRELSPALLVDTVTVVMRIVREQQSPESVASAQTAWLVHKVLSRLGEKEGKHDTFLRIPEATFASWANRMRTEIRLQGHFERQ